jgi:hypothetical protein
VRQPIPFGKYLLLDRISVGGMAEVFKAKSYGVEGFEKVIAIKRILPTMGEDRDFIKMFIDEAKIAGQLAHANICQIFELGRIDGAHFIAMEYIWGKDLLQIQNRFRKRKQVMPVAMACHVIAKICEGLDYAHRKRDPMGRSLEIVHRDCSPQNVLCSYEGEVKLIDFGIAKAASRSSQTMAGVLKGKFGYMSPEQVRGLPLDRRSDIFALGTVLYESLTGERLFQGESDFSTLEKVRNVDILPPSHLNRNIPIEVEQIVMRALERDPDDRYQWCNELHADLQRYLMSQEQVFTAKNLGHWLKEGFEAELARERQLMEKYKQMGRDGLFAGKPAAEANLDVVEHLGEAGTAEGDPTVLGGPSFDDIVEDEPPAGLRPRRAQTGGDDFGDEAPTELFGEIGDEDLLEDSVVVRPDTDAPTVDAKIVVDRHIAEPQGEAASSPGAARAAAPVSHALPHPAAVMSPVGAGVSMAPGVPQFTPSGMSALDSGPMLRRPDEFSFDVTAPVPPLSTPRGMRALQADGSRRRRDRGGSSSVLKDVAIGIGIAALVLGLFAGGKYVFFGDTPGTRVAQASETGTIAVTVPDEQPADVWVNGEKMGVVSADPFTLETTAGQYEVKVTRLGVDSCERAIDLEARKVEIITCSFRAPAPGKVVLEGLAASHRVLLDGRELSAEDAAAIELSPRVEHAFTILSGDTVIEQFTVTLEDGEERVRAVAKEAEEAAVDDDANERALAEEARARREERRRAAAERAERKDPAAQLSRNLLGSIGATTARSQPGGAKPAESKPAEPRAEARAKAEEVGYLLAYTTPWARVHVNGKDTGKMTPIAQRAKIPLRPGKHTVTFVVGRETFDYVVVIEPGKDRRLVEDLPVKSN